MGPQTSSRAPTNPSRIEPRNASISVIRSLKKPTQQRPRPRRPRIGSSPAEPGPNPRRPPDLPRQAAAGGETHLDWKLTARGIEWGLTRAGSAPGGARIRAERRPRAPPKLRIFWAPEFYFRGGGGSSKKRSFFSQSLQNLAIHNGNVLRRVM